MPTLLAVALVGLVSFQEVSAQNATTSTPAANQTAIAIGNLTQSDFDAVQDNMQRAREGLQQNDTVGSYYVLSFAKNELFSISNEQANPSTLDKLLQPLRSHITSAQNALQDGDNAKALEEINTIDVELLKVTQRLPPGEEEQEQEEEE
jgi:hypothetical protein